MTEQNSNNDNNILEVLPDTQNAAAQNSNTAEIPKVSNEQAVDISVRQQKPVKQKGKKKDAAIVLIVVIPIVVIAFGVFAYFYFHGGNPNNNEPAELITEPTTAAIIAAPTTAATTIKPTAEPTLKTVDDYIGTLYSDRIINDSLTVSYNVPKIVGIDSDYAKEINSELSNLADEFKTFIEDNKNNDTGIIYGGGRWQDETLAALNNDILSLVLQGRYDGGSRWYNVYNINVKTGSKVTTADIIKSKNISDQQFVEKLQALSTSYTMEEYPFDHVSSWISRERYDEYLEAARAFCSIETPLFYDENGDLKVVLYYCCFAGSEYNQAILDMDFSIPAETPNAAQTDSIVLNQKFIGTWYTDEDKLNSLTISEINADEVKFKMSIFRLMSLSATSKAVNNEIKWGENISPDYDGPAMSGTLKFNENSISVIIDESEFEYIPAGTVYNFIVG